MRVSMIARFALSTVIAIGAACTVNAAAKVSPAETAIQAAAKQNRYAVVTFYKQKDEASTKMLAEVKKLQGKHSNKATFVNVDVGNTIHANVIAKYDADRSPIPLTIVIAPNGAVTAGYPEEIKKTDISDAFVSSGMADVLKAIQDGKLAAVCLQNSKTKHNKESLAAAEGLNKQGQFRGVVEVVKIDPSSKSESKLIQMCKASANSDEAQIVIIAPSGGVVAKFDGTATTASITTALTKAFSSGGCTPGSGCCPK